jgi:endonuclease/exonuclease/phosphatase (EEP) superfamily protein YafD
VESVAIIKDVISKLKDKPVLIAGDMNAKPTTKPIVAFKEFATLLSDDTWLTYSSNNPRRCIDYIFGVNGKFNVTKRHIFNQSLLSDHFPIYVDVKVGKTKSKK